MVGKDSYPVYMILGLVVAVYCSHAFGMRPLSQDYHLVKPELVPWHHQTTPSDWYGFTLEFTDGMSISKWPSLWDFFIEMIVILSGAVLLGRFQSKSGGRNITAIVSAFGVSGFLVALGVIVESIGNSQSVIPLNALLIMLGVLHLVGSICLLMPIQRIRVLAGISVLCVVSHWALVQFVIGGDVVSGTNIADQTQVVESETIHQTVWDNNSGVTSKVSEFLKKALPMSMRNSGLSSDFQNYNPINIVAYLGLLFAGMIGLQVLKGSRLTQKLLGFVGLTLFCICISLALAYVGIPAVPGLASPTHTLMAAGLAFGLLAIATVLMHPVKLRLIFTPCVALGLCSALVYVLERVLGAAMRTEAAKHLEPVLKPMFGEHWLKWEPIVFCNLIFCCFVALAMYCYKRRIGFSL